MATRSHASRHHGRVGGWTCWIGIVSRSASHPSGTVGRVTLYLTAAADPASLVDAVASVLEVPLDDPFVAEVVAVPGDGVRAWLTSVLSTRLGARGPDTEDGIVANVDIVFPAALVARALGERPERDPWAVGPLGWAVHEVLRTEGDRLGVTADAVRARSIADVLDHYALHRPSMVRNWERGVDVDVAGRPVPAHLRWQPELWRTLCARLGHPSGPATVSLAAAELRTGRRRPDLPERVVVFGLASLPPLHLTVLSALATQIDVHVVTPVWSVPVWRSVVSAATSGAVVPPVERSQDPTSALVRHPLGQLWGRVEREAQFLLALAATDAPTVHRIVEPEETSATPATVLARLQSAVRDDRSPPGPIEDGSVDPRPEADQTDQSIRWYRCHGVTRQAEVLRDAVLHLLEETDEDGAPRYEPRDIAILCPDVPTFAPPLTAAFAGDPDHGVPSIPFRVADRSLRTESPLVAVVTGVLALLDGRLRASELLALATSGPVARRFGFGPDVAGQLVDWVERTNIRWGADAVARRSFGVPDAVAAHTWQHGLDQVALGSALADPGLRPHGLVDADGPGGAPWLPEVEGDSLAVFGAFASFVEIVCGSVVLLGSPSTPVEWTRRLVRAVDRLCELTDDEAWHRRALDRELDAFATDAVVGGAGSVTVEPDQLVTLLLARLGGRPGRPRFGTGAVTLSSLTARRGVPHPVVCIVGLDADVTTGVARADDLVAAAPCLGDADPRGEHRAQLLDAVLAAGDRLVLVSTGADVRTNAEVPPPVALAELLDVLDATARPPSSSPARSCSAWITVDHPRHAWSAPNFEPAALGVPGPWSFDRGARDAAHGRHVGPRWFVGESLAPEPPGDVHVADVARSLANPVRSLLEGRLGIQVVESEEAIDDLVPVTLDALARSRVRAGLLAAVDRSGRGVDPDLVDDWLERRRRAGGVPPGALGAADTTLVRAQVEALVAARNAHGASPVAPPPVEVDVTIGGRRWAGSIPSVSPNGFVEVTSGVVRDHHRLQHWLRLLVLATLQPTTTRGLGRRGTLIGLSSSTDAKIVVESRSTTHPDAVADALSVVLEFHELARREVVPLLPTTSRALAEGSVTAATGAWRSSFAGGGTGGDGRDVWVRFALGDVELDDLLAAPPTVSERGDGWSDAASRWQRWADRLWGAVESSTVADPTPVPEDAPT